MSWAMPSPYPQESDSPSWLRKGEKCVRPFGGGKAPVWWCPEVFQQLPTPIAPMGTELAFIVWVLAQISAVLSGAFLNCCFLSTQWTPPKIDMALSLFFNFNFYFLNYILLIMLSQFSWLYLLCTLSTQHTPLPQAIPPPLLMSWVMHISSLATPFPILYFTSTQLFCNYLFTLLNPLTSSLIPPCTPPIWQPSKCSVYPWFCLCSCLLSLVF